MKKIILFLACLVLSRAFAMDKNSEAIVLNQELQFLEESANMRTPPPATPVPMARRASATRDLEETYFGNEEEDAVTTRSASRRRRGTD